MTNYDPTIVMTFKNLMEELDNYTRREILEDIISDYCRECYSTDPRCQCWNDE